ncbi:DoxX family protein [Catellatospora tritici]|uniref:DoxX family protein n=1 Tax=Catellatospora tritici TaxID=2851566 RepID=UPI001C2D3F8F|nr:DoxX family protein [Catellatospora tritici]MBV1854353.1 DoxX family protein [Catellatospora tritici]
MTLPTTILAVLLALAFAALGTAKVRAVPAMRELAAEAGFTTAAYRRIGALELAAAVGVLLGLIQPLIGALAAAGLLLLLTGAIVVHVRKGDGPRKAAPAIVCALLAVAYLILLLAGA